MLLAHVAAHGRGSAGWSLGIGEGIVALIGGAAYVLRRK